MMKLGGMYHIFLLAMMWGPSMMLMKIAVAEYPPLSMIALRVGLAALLSLTLIWKRERLSRDWQLWKCCAVQGFFSCGLPFVIFAYAVTSINSSVSSVVVGLVPVFTCLLAHCLLPSEKLNFQRVFGVFLGLLGFSIILLPTLLDGDFSADSAGILGCLLGAVCYAIGMVYTRKNLTGKVTGMTGTAMQLTTVSLYLIPLALWWDRPWHIAMPSMQAIIAVLILSVFGTFYAFILYFKIVQQNGATALSMVGYLLPVIGILCGAIILDEHISWNFVVATTCILAAMLLVNEATKQPKISHNKLS